MEHLNDNILCVVDVETTGLIPRYHDIVEICILPLGNDLKPCKKFVPFAMSLVPMRIENFDEEALRIQRKFMDYEQKDKICWKRDRLSDHILKGCEPSRAADLFMEWFEKLKLIPFKRIMPVAHNWCFDREFIMDWLGQETFELCFDPRYRDTMVMANYENDIAGYFNEPFPFPKVNLQYLCSQFRIERNRAHNAFDDCVATAEVFRAMIKQAYIVSARS